MPYDIRPRGLTTGDTILTDEHIFVDYGNSSAPDAALVILTCSTGDSYTDQTSLPSGTSEILTMHGQGFTGVRLRGSICTMDPIAEKDFFEITDITIADSSMPPPASIGPLQKIVRKKTKKDGKEIEIAEKVVTVNARKEGELVVSAGNVVTGNVYILVQERRRHGQQYIREIHQAFGPTGVTKNGQWTIKMDKLLQSLPQETWERAQKAAEARAKHYDAARQQLEEDRKKHAEEKWFRGDRERLQASVVSSEICNLRLVLTAGAAIKYATTFPVDIII